MKQILIVDDNPQNLYMLRMLLGGSGYRVTEAANGQEALEKARQDCPDMVVADILMPVMDGFELCRQWKADPGLNQKPFIFYTATYTDPKDEEFALGLGAERFVVKPQEPKALLAILEEVLVAWKGESRVPEAPSSLREQVYMKGYNEVLIRKLEDKMRQLEVTNRLLEQDIAERIKAQADLRRLATAIDQTGDVVMITDPEGRIVYLNPAFEQVTGYAREEALGRNPRLLKSGRQDRTFYEQLWQTIQSGKTWSGRLINRRKDGILFTEEATISPVLDAAGDIVHYVSVKRDITETLQIGEQFQQAMKMEAVGRLAGGVAHDINNALTPLISVSAILLKKLKPDDPLYSDIHLMQESGQRCANLTRQLLAFSRNHPVAMMALDINQVVTAMVKMLSRLIGEDIHLVKVLDPTLARIMGDVGQMEQIIANLVVNARDAMPHGGELIIETKNVALDETDVLEHFPVKPGPHVMLAVRDTGVGMNEETRAHAFEPFFSTKEKGKGTGLGLSTVYGIVKQSKGGIQVSSEPGQGTAVRIFLPVYSGEEETGGVVAQVEQAAYHGSETVLLVEDEDGVRTVAKRILTDLGYTVVEATCADEAILFCEKKQKPIHLVITDLVMPGMNGKEMSRRLALLCPEMKFLFMSGYTDNILDENEVNDDWTHFIQKPFSFDSLGAKVRQILDET
jgi:PAS domain S-box-containing protein